MTESEIQAVIREAINYRQGYNLIRANVGTKGFHVGLPKGFPDLFGYKSRIIEAGDIGKRMAQFAFIEVKKPCGKVRSEQRKMIKKLLEAGAIGGIAHSLDEAEELLEVLKNA